LQTAELGGADVIYMSLVAARTWRCFIQRTFSHCY